MALFGLVAGAAVFTYYYARFSRLIDERLQGQVFPNVSQLYAAPERLRVGDPATQSEIIARLRTAGYGEDSDNPKGRYQKIANGLRTYPGPGSYFSREPAEIHFANGKVSSIVSLNDQFARSEIYLEPQLITNLFDRSREKRRIIEFKDLPEQLVQAVVAIEDRRFFEHSGIDYVRLLKAAWVDLTSGRFRQGASTITQQVARSLFLNREGTLNRENTLRRKIAEAVVALQLEHRLTKEEIFETYANTIYLGQRGSFSIQGFGEGAQAYFRKDLRNLSLPEIALLAGLPRGPNLYSPYRSPENARKRRNQVLDAMLEMNYISRQKHDEAVAAPLAVAPSYSVATESPYFVDIVKDQLLDRFSEEDLTTQSYHVYTTLDIRLQRAAAEAVEIGMKEVDERLTALRKARLRRRGVKATDAEAAAAGPKAQVALVALDPHTGAVKALIGGRDYGESQLNRALALRQPGSVFKPFVYAAALTAYQTGHSDHPWTAASKVVDEPTTFEFDGKPYQPANFEQDYLGTVTLRTALMHSLNVATVKVAEAVGYNTVVELAHRAGLNEKILPTPAVALGAYEVSPLEVAGAYTIFANQGVRVEPYLVSMMRDRNGLLLDVTYPKKTQVLEPAVAFLMTNLMQSVINGGTAVGVRARGFLAPAAGKTGTSHDGWFAGYTSTLLCIVWVGFDSDLELGLQGAHSALPIWTEFMKRAIAVPEYSDVKEFTPPPQGIVQALIDPDSGQLATPNCPKTQTEYFLTGTEPGQYCELHYMPEVPRGLPAPPPIAHGAPLLGPEPVVPPETAAGVPASAPPPVPAPPPPQPQPEKKKGFFGRILGIFGGGDQGKK